MLALTSYLAWLIKGADEIAVKLNNEKDFKILPEENLTWCGKRCWLLLKLP